MKELVLVGRGGQGVVLASQILADTLARAGYWAQCFPEFKAERRGAPISAFVRWDTVPIHRRYKVHTCDVLVAVSAAPPSPQLIGSVRPGGLIVLNRDGRFPYRGPFELARVPGSRIARAHGILSPEGRPMANMAVLGACVKLLLPDGLALLEQAVAARLGGELADANVLAARDGYDCCTRQRAVVGDQPLQVVEPFPAPQQPPVFAVSRTDSLASHTGSWSEEQPVLGAACTACAVCALFCPEGAITRTGGLMHIDTLYCKGCGICAVVCPVRNAIAMEEVTA
jgi:2-oxoacid:acceptor oxidoreductase gamma subunit (pyruvate/2-ketoisovalerate family)/2-oxoacid:acceptor oxidoreductase delta subunit (pyruvate/2-ketoisovalerate family)